MEKLSEARREGDANNDKAMIVEMMKLIGNSAFGCWRTLLTVHWIWSSMASHLDRFSDLVLAIEAVRDEIDTSRQLVILLGSLPADYETIVIENSNGLSLDEVKEKLLKQYENLQH
jgi:gag-polypeptide of LTR copia-type